MRRFRKHQRAVEPLSLSSTLFVLPNALTLSSLACGFEAIRITSTDGSDQRLQDAALLLCFAALFDFLDGRVARLTKTQSEFGLELDSLADLVSFGVAPALLMYRWALHQVPFWGPAAALAYVACGAVRLARFNVLSRRRSQGSDRYIVGLPIPPAATVLVSLVWIDASTGGSMQLRPPATWPLMVVLSGLMVSTIRFRSFKHLRADFRTTLAVLFGVFSSALVWWWMQAQFVVLWLLAVYVTFGVLESALRLLRYRLRT